jgi:hypothetical protein
MYWLLMNDMYITIEKVTIFIFYINGEECKDHEDAK